VLTAHDSMAKGGKRSAPARTASSRHSAAARRIGEERRGPPKALVQMFFHVDRLTGGRGAGSSCASVQTATSRGRESVTSDNAGAGDHCLGANAGKAYMLTRDWCKLHAKAL